MNTTHTITLFLDQHHRWMANYSDPSVVELFGISIVPTAFTQETPKEQVLSVITRLNPDVLVEFAEGVLI